MMMRILYCLNFLIMVGSCPVLAALPSSPLVVAPGKVSSGLSGGTWIGGRSGEELSLLSVKLETVASDRERLTLYFGDRRGRPYKGEPGFFHVHLDRSGGRLVIDLSQLSRTAVDPVKLTQIVAGSRNLASSEMSMDPIDGSTNLTFKALRPIEVAVTSIAGEPASFSIELHAAKNPPVGKRAQK